MDAISRSFTFLSNKRKLERDKGITLIKELLKESRDDKLIIALERSIFELFSLNTWESNHGALIATGTLLSAGVLPEGLCKEVQLKLPLLLEDCEPRVRLAAGELVGQLCRCYGVEVFAHFQDVLLSGIKLNLERDSDSSCDFPPQDAMEQEIDVDERPRSPDSALILHDTAGWKALETYMIALEQAVSGCQASFAPYVTSDLFELIFTCLGHMNRFVRATGYKTLTAILKCPGLTESILAHQWPAVAHHLAIGLADNWSQVRMSASVATREFLSNDDDSSTSSEETSLASRGLTYLPLLLPPMCLNRYYVAEGVKLYSQETWRRVTSGQGVAMVEQNVAAVVEFYISQSQASNHAVREAACACIAELGTKVSRHCLQPFVSKLITVLLECFKDDSWPVRDAACLASGNFVSCFPEECRGSVDGLFPLFLANLEDSIPSVRQGAAVALAELLTAYGSDVEERIFSVLRERLPQVALQSSSQNTPTVDPSPAVFGVVKMVESTSQEADVDMAHTDQQMYSCGSLAPKMMKGGCMSASFHRAAMPWERSEGCVHLLTALSYNSRLSGQVEALLPILAEACRARHYPQYLSYLETVLKQLPLIAKALGKRTFKRHLELFLDSIFHSLSCDSALVKGDGVQCLNLLTRQIGKMIMRGRIEQHNSRWLSVFDQTVT